MKYENPLIKENLAHKTSPLGMYTSFAVLVFIVFGLAGTKSNWEGINRYNIKNAEVQELEKKVKDKKDYLIQTEQDLEEYSAAEEALEVMIPQGEKFEKYVEEIIDSNSGYGFNVSRVAFTNSQPDRLRELANVSIEFVSTEEDPDLTGLVKSLEKTPRISIIDKLNYKVITDRRILTVDLKIYKIKGQ